MSDTTDHKQFLNWDTFNPLLRFCVLNDPKISHPTKNHLQLPYLFQLYRALSKVQIEMRVDWLLVVVVERLEFLLE